ncbi:MAG: hypothetical protein K0S79_62 [Nitrospira sp.]|jgi:hypothetical protein|nr:hypothetical protein [Nitrospira sp.]
MPDVIEHKGFRCYRWETQAIYPSVSAVKELLYGPISGWIDTAKLDEGTRCHQEMERAIETWILTGSPDGVELSERPQKLIKWLQDTGWEPLATELPRVSTKYGYAGTLDAVFRKGGTLMIPDYKFAESVGEQYHAQLMMYLNADYQDIAHKDRKAFILQVAKGQDVKPLAVKPNPVLWAEILAALTVLRKRMR